MTRAVFDCSVVLAGIGWSGTARRCLRLVAQRRVFLYATEEILSEYEAVIPPTLADEMPEIDSYPKLAWVRSKSRVVEPLPLGKQRSRDPKDDIYLACALGASAEFLLTYDRDLLVLEKPFGIQTIRPAEFLRRFER